MRVSIKQGKALDEPFCDECGKAPVVYDVEVTQGLKGRQLARLFLCKKHLHDLQGDLNVFLRNTR